MPHPHIPLCFDFALYECVESFHMISIDVTAGVGAPPLEHISQPLEILQQTTLTPQQVSILCLPAAMHVVRFSRLSCVTFLYTT